MTIANAQRKIIDHYAVVRHMKQLLRNKRVVRVAKESGVAQSTVSQMRLGAGCQLQTFIRLAHHLGYEVTLTKALK